MRQTTDLHVVATRPLPSPDLLRHEVSQDDALADFVGAMRDDVRAVLLGRDPRLVVVVGPCSIHDIDAARDYARHLGAGLDRWSDALVVLMRVYFEKPRTTTGWKGLISDPHLDGSHDMNTGLRLARTLLRDLADARIPAACEMLDPVTPQYLADLVAWGAIGARTTESQTHRMMASGLSMPVGFKNSTDGSLTAAINAIEAAAHPHHFLGINGSGLVSVVETTGNGHCHLVLRGGKSGPNYGPEAILSACDQLQAAGLLPRVMVDCSHGNSLKDHQRQPLVAEAIAEQVAAGDERILGVMIESNLVAGRQPFPRPPNDLVYGQSITDACVDFTTTERMLDRLAAAVRSGRSLPTT